MKISRNDKGSALVIVLGMLAVLMLMAVAFSIIMRTERAGTTNLRHSVTAQNGIQTAIAHAIRDIENDIGDKVIPEKWDNFVMASAGTGVTYDVLQKSDKSSEVKVTILNERAQRHLNPTTRALIKNTKVDWRLIYAGAPLSNFAVGDGEYLAEDSIIGRIAYVAVNTTGYLDSNMVSETNPVYTVPAEALQFIDKSFTSSSVRTDKKNYGFVSNASDEFLNAREKERKHGFTSFANMVSHNESHMYSNGRLKGSPKMFINLFDPSVMGSRGRSCLFLPDVFGPAAAFGMCPYPTKMKELDDYEGTILEDIDPITEAVQIDIEKDFDEILEEAYVAFNSVFERKNWNEVNSHGESKKEFESPVTNVEWEFPRVGQMRSTITRADMALIAFAEYFSYKKGNPVSNNEFLEKAIDIINENSGSPIYSRPYSFDGESYEGYLNAPCFKSVPMLTTVLGWTDRPALKPDVLYHHDGGGKFSEVGDDAVIPPGISTDKYYAKYELPVHFLLWAANPYGKDAPENDAKMNVKIKFGENLDGSELFTHINGGDDISGDPDVIVDPDKTFAKSVEDPLEISGNEKNSTIKIEEEPDEVITVYVKYPGNPRTSSEDSPILISDIKGEYSWEKAKFGDSLENYSIDVFLTANIESDGTIVQAVPAPRIGRGKEDDLSSYVHFKLPLFRKEANNHSCHRIGYAMPIDQRFAYATECLNEYREGGLESFPYWVNNVMAENVGEFSSLKSYEMSLSDPEDFTPTSNMAPDPTNPYAKLAMGYTAEGDGDVNSAFWEGLMKHDSTGLDYGRPYPDTLHKVPGNGVYTANLDYDKSDIEVDWGDKGAIESVGELGMLCIGPWETISLYRTETPNGEYDFHTVLDFFTVDPPSQLVPGRLNLNAPPLLVSQEDSSSRVKLATDHGGAFSNPTSFDVGGKSMKAKAYSDATGGMNPEPLTTLFYDYKEAKSNYAFDYYTAWEIASRIIYQNIDLGSDGAFSYFKDISQLGYSDSQESLLGFMMDEDNIGDFDAENCNPYSDQGREKVISRIAPYVTTRGQTFTIVVRSDAFAPKFGSDVEGTTLASKVAVVEAWRDTEPARDSEGNSLGYHNWHIRSVRIID